MPFFFHWYIKGEVPVAITEKLAVLPVITVKLVGSVVIRGASAWEVTARLALVLVMVPALLLTTTENSNPAPMSSSLVASVV